MTTLNPGTAASSSSAPNAIGVLEQLRSQGARLDNLTADSRAVREGYLFVAYPGRRSDGRLHIEQALAAGARSVLWEREGFQWDVRWQVPNLAVDGLQHLTGHLAHEIYGRPSAQLWVVGVTGTNGKTSTSQWIAQSLALAGRHPLVIGTLGMGMVGEVPVDSPNTTPDAIANTTPDAIVLHRSFAESLARGADSVSMEVSSIGIDQGRVEGVAFDLAVFTNLTRDHLDYHGDMERYARAKLQLFALPTLSAVIVNLDDPLAERILDALESSPERKLRRIGYTMDRARARRLPAARHLDAMFVADDIRHRGEGVAFRVHSEGSDGSSIAIQTGLIGRFNVSNLLAVIGTLVASGIDFATAVSLVAKLAPVPGRMQRAGGNGKPIVIVDYAHTPDALEKLLLAAREIAAANDGRVLALFGCGGDRDTGKRPIMGEIASRLADHVIITSDNPRTESPRAIIDDILGGVSGARTVNVDRAVAIRDTIRGAGPNDVVVLAGKGHEAYQEIAGRRYPFSDLHQARGALGEAQPC